LNTGINKVEAFSENFEAFSPKKMVFAQKKIAFAQKNETFLGEGSPISDFLTIHIRKKSCCLRTKKGRGLLNTLAGWERLEKMQFLLFLYRKTAFNGSCKAIPG